MNTPNSRETDHSPRELSTLERILGVQGRTIETLAEPGVTLTVERLLAVDSRYDNIREQADMADIGWPDDETALSVRADGCLARLVGMDSEAADRIFVAYMEAAERVGNSAYNNLPAHLRVPPTRPEQDEAFGAYATRSGSPSNASYSTKPYLWRAHMILPDFMQSLQFEILARKSGGLSGWEEAVHRGALEPDVYPEDAALLRSSRLAYSLLANLMRSDDLGRQYRWMGMDGQNAEPIKDPEIELWT